MGTKNTVSLFEYCFEQYKNQTLSKKELLHKTTKNVLNMCSCYPGFPDCTIITNISGEKYEKTECCASMVFVDSKFCDQKNFKFVYEYKIPVELSSQNIRLVRKLLEAVNSECSLVIVDNKLTGVIQNKLLAKLPVPTVKITGHMTWQAYIGQCPMFEYVNGEYRAIEDKFNKEKFIVCWENTFDKSLRSFSSQKIKRCKDGILRVLNIISKQGIGTSIVLLDEESYKKEVERLTREKSGHGIELSKKFSLFNMTTQKAQELLSQIIKIDGGLLISLTGNCCSMGCIFDGMVDHKFEGNIARGSRYNSVKLYVHNMIKKSNRECMGIVLSDDETIDFLPI